MKKRQTRNFLIRNMPIELYNLLAKSAKEHHRSKIQEAIVAITHGLSMYNHAIKKPIPFKWNQKICSKFIEEAIKEGRNDHSIADKSIILHPHAASAQQ